MIKTILSDGQYGVGQAALKVAMELGIDMNGSVPNGWNTKFGSRPQLKKLGLFENSDSDYKSSIKWNIEHSDATVCFGLNFSKFPISFIHKIAFENNKECFDIDMKDAKSGCNLYSIDIYDFFDRNNVETLNVVGISGNTKKKSKHIYSITKEVLYTYINLYNKKTS